MSIIKLGGIEIFITYKKIKNVHLNVYPPNGKVRVSAPVGMDIDIIRAFVITKFSWIKQQQYKFITQEREAPRDFIEREGHYYLGMRYLLRIIESSGRSKVELGHKEITMYVKPEYNTEKRKMLLNKWYRSQLKQIIPSIISKYEKLMSVSVAEFGVKRMKTRWGTCNPDAKRIWLNLELAKKPIECLEYIIVHEMVHLLERSHNKRFISLMDVYLPKWQLYRDELNRLPVKYETWQY